MLLVLVARRPWLWAALALITTCATAGADPVTLRATPDDLIGRRRFHAGPYVSVSSETMELAGDLWVASWSTEGPGGCAGGTYRIAPDGSVETKQLQEEESGRSLSRDAKSSRLFLVQDDAVLVYPRHLGSLQDTLLVKSPGQAAIVDGTSVVTVFRAGTVTENLRAREKPNTEAKIVEYVDATYKTASFLPTGTELVVSARTVDKRKVGDWNEYWYHVAWSDVMGRPLRAWVFGQFVRLGDPVDPTAQMPGQARPLAVQPSLFAAFASETFGELPDIHGGSEASDRALSRIPDAAPATLTSAELMGLDLESEDDSGQRQVLSLSGPSWLLMTVKKDGTALFSRGTLPWNDNGTLRIAEGNDGFYRTGSNGPFALYFERWGRRFWDAGTGRRAGERWTHDRVRVVGVQRRATVIAAAKVTTEPQANGKPADYWRSARQAAPAHELPAGMRVTAIAQTEGARGAATWTLVLFADDGQGVMRAWVPTDALKLGDPAGDPTSDRVGAAYLAFVRRVLETPHVSPAQVNEH